MESIFRFLILFTAILSLLFWGMPYFDHIWFSVEQLYLLGKNGYGSVIPGSDFFYWGTLLIWLALSVGLYFYNYFARAGFVIFYFFEVFVGLFSGVQVLNPYEYAVSSLIGLADGAIIAIAYLTSIENKFVRNP